MFRDAVDRSVKRRAANAMADRVVVAVKAEKLISKSALAWALNHVVHPGDCITLLAVLSGERTGNFELVFLRCLINTARFSFVV